MNIRTRVVTLASTPKASNPPMRFSRRFVLLVALTALVLGSIVLPALAAKPAKPPGKPVKPVQSADISLSITDSPDPALAAKVTYSATIANAGPSSASAYLLAHLYEDTESGPFGATVDVTSSQGTCKTSDASNENTTVTRVSCELGTLPRSAAAQVTVVVTPVGPGTLTLQASAWGDKTDPNTSNNQEVESTTVIGVGDVPGVGDVLCGVDIPDVTPPSPELGVEDFLESTLCSIAELYGNVEL